MSPFDAATQHASPGSYSVRLGQPSIAVDLAVTRRTGISRFTFPATADANVLFKAADSATGSDTATVHVVGSREVEGSVTSGHFCDTPGSYRLFFDAQFDRPFARFATWKGESVRPESRNQSGSHSGAAVTFDATHDRTVDMKVGISFVSAANAHANLAAENRHWSVDAIRRGHAEWTPPRPHRSHGRSARAATDLLFGAVPQPASQCLQ
jgi:putative alpha-1,2-mannosidase